MKYYLILEDDDEYYNEYFLPAQKDYRNSDKEFESIHVRTVNDAFAKLATTRFDGAILDLRLSSIGEAEGNDVARKIHSDYLVPIAIVSGFLDELDDDFQKLAEVPNGFFRSFNKSCLSTDVFDFLDTVSRSGVNQVFGPGGELTKIISNIFWNHFSAVFEEWHGLEMNSSDKKRVLRYAGSHILSALQSDEGGEWDKCLPSEIYIWPPICLKEMPGQIYEKENPVNIPNDFLLLVTPYCDISKMNTRHFVRILPFSEFPSRSKIESKLKKTEYRYHVLPPTKFFVGGVVDFSTLHTMPSNDSANNLIHRGSLIEPFWRELVNRLSMWLGRQGTPDFQREDVFNLIKKQWPS